jgi:general secretion pathway protein D/MSHA biogenesis protein MshL
MKKHIRLLPCCLAAALLLCSCVEKNKKSEAAPAQTAAAEPTAQHRTVVEPSLLPNRFRQTGYMISEEKSGSASGDSSSAEMDGLQLKVGVNISTKEPIQLRDALKAIAKTKNMGLSWAPDVDQNLLIDIDVKANDNFYEAIDNILRQLDYFQEVEGSTMVIKYRDTKQYHVSMPFISQKYSSATGMKSLDSSTKLGSDENTFDLWENIQKNLDSLMSTWVTTVANQETKKAEDKKAEKGKTAEKTDNNSEESAAASPVARQVSSTKSSYTIDKPVGLITVHAPKSLQKKISSYLATLEQELYKQITIEAKIIEVQLNDSSSLGVNWNTLLDQLKLDGLQYYKDKYYAREDSATQQTLSDRSYNDTRNDGNYSNHDRTSSSVYGLDGSSNTSSTSGKTSTSATSSAAGANTRSSGSTSSSGTLSDDALTANSSILDSSTDASGSSSSRTITDALSMGATAATFIGSGGGLTEAMVGGVSLGAFSFTSFIKSLQAQGQTTVLSNPKISVMNGQPALISVGKNVTYISKIEADVDAETKITTYTATTDKVLSGIGLALSAVVNKNNNEIVMNLVPITSELTEPIEYRKIGLGEVGLPIVNMREMNTTVKVKDGSMLVVGGLISDKEISEGENFVPGTKNIPYLKYLFGYEEKRKIKRELIILLRPHIIN